MKLFKIDTGHFMCDGGALFGVIPKIMWSKKYPADDDNYCQVTLRCLLIDTGDRCVLVDTGIGHKQSEKFFSYSRLFGDGTMDKSLAEAGYTANDITDVILSHLHYDHCGGCVIKDENNDLQLVFPNATHWVSKAQWDNYLDSNIREGAVYFPENMMPVYEAGKLQVMDKEGEWIPGIEVQLYDGHTPGNAIPIANTPMGKIAFMGDVIPVIPSIALTWTAAYDVNPITSIEDKRRFLEYAAKEDVTLFFEHDFYHECCNVEKGSRGVALKSTYSLEEFANR